MPDLELSEELSKGTFAYYVVDWGVGGGCREWTPHVVERGVFSTT